MSGHSCRWESMYKKWRVGFFTMSQSSVLPAVPLDQGCDGDEDEGHADEHPDVQLKGDNLKGRRRISLFIPRTYSLTGCEDEWTSKRKILDESQVIEKNRVSRGTYENVSTGNSRSMENLTWVLLSVRGVSAVVVVVVVVASILQRWPLDERWRARNEWKYADNRRVIRQINKVKSEKSLSSKFDR